MGGMNPERRQRYLQAMGVQLWVPRAGTPVTARAAEPALAPEPVVAPRGAAVGARPAPVAESVKDLDWSALQARVAACVLCPDLVANRSQTVFGVGNRQADWMIVGEAPGGEEDRQGEPFVGPAGQLLNAMLRAIGLARAQVYIANVLKCRPPGNRDPRPEEAQNCRPFLHRQIELVSPKLILVVGRIAAHNLLQTDTPLGKLRGRVHRHEATGVPVVVTYHPAYLLRNPADKAKVWEDLKFARRFVQGGA